MAEILVHNATKDYVARDGIVHALYQVDLHIREGEFVCILGPSGCGKTTLLWAISGLHPLTRGQVFLNGEPITGPRPEIGLVFQEANLLPWRTIMQNAEFPFEIKRIPPQREKIVRLLESVGLAGFEQRFPRELSGGMQQRAALVRCLALDPQVLLMDEPFGALDPFTRDEMNMLLLSIWERLRPTVVLVTHSIQEAILLADRVVVMSPRPGRVSAEFPIPLPRPRRLDMVTDPEFVDLVRRIRETIDAGAGRPGPTVEGAR